MPITSTTKSRRWRLLLTLQKAEAGKYKVELKEWPVGILASLHKAYLNGGPNSASALVDVGKLPRLEGAKEQADRTSTDRLSYSVPGTLADTTAATQEAVGRPTAGSHTSRRWRSPTDSR